MFLLHNVLGHPLPPQNPPVAAATEACCPAHVTLEHLGEVFSEVTSTFGSMSSNSAGNLPGSFLPSFQADLCHSHSRNLGDVTVEVAGKVQRQISQGHTQRNLGRSRSQQNFSQPPIFRKKEQRLKTHNHDDDDDQDNNTDETRRDDTDDDGEGFGQC